MLIPCLKNNVESKWEQHLDLWAYTSILSTHMHITCTERGRKNEKYISMCSLFLRVHILLQMKGILRLILPARPSQNVSYHWWPLAMTVPCVDIYPICAVGSCTSLKPSAIALMAGNLPYNFINNHSFLIWAIRERYCEGSCSKIASFCWGPDSFQSSCQWQYSIA